MNMYVALAGKGKAKFSKFYREIEKDKHRDVKQALKTVQADEETKQMVSYLLGFGKSCSQSNEARLSDGWVKWEFFYKAITQLKIADPRMQVSFKRFLINGPGEDGRPHDLKSAKRAIEPQLKREFHGYVAKFVHLVDDGLPVTAVNALGFSFDTLADPNRKPRRRASKRHSVFEPSAAIAPSSESAVIAGMIAEFLQPLASRPEKQKADAKRVAKAQLNALIYRGLMRTERIFFGHGIGKNVVRRVIPQILNLAAASDILELSPLQPEGILSFLASLPINGDGTTAILPPIKLP